MAFKYDIITLIELIEQRPTLWDKFNDDYKDRIKKKNEWREVFSFLENNFEEMSNEDQHKIGELIIQKWGNIRDAFVRTLKKKSGQALTKKYIYHDQLQFLLKIIEKDQTASSLDETVPEDIEDNLVSPKVMNDSTDPKVLSSKKNRGCKRKLDDELDREILKALQEDKIPPRLDEDESFFASVIPPIKQFSEDEKLEFRMGVIKLIQDIKLRRHRQPNPSPHHSHFLPVVNSPYQRYEYTRNFTDPHNFVNNQTTSITSNASTSSLEFIQNNDEQ